MALPAIFLILAALTGIAFPHFLRGKLTAVSIVLPRRQNSATPAPEHRISGTAVIWFLRGLGVCLALVAVLCLI
jgi:hypothetical protein